MRNRPKKLFYSNTFDFTSMGGALVKKLLKELQSSIGFYEVQTASRSERILHPAAGQPWWLGATMAGALGVPQLKDRYVALLESLGINWLPGDTQSPTKDGPGSFH